MKWKKFWKSVTKKIQNFLWMKHLLNLLKIGRKKQLHRQKLIKKNLFIIRAFTKFFAIPGLRLGYGIFFDKEDIFKVNAKKEPWSVNSLAEIAGTYVVDDLEYIKKTENWIQLEKKYMFEQLSKIKELEVFETEVNFILAKIKKGMNSKKLQEKMLEHGILIRDASNFIFLNKNFFRLAIKDRRNNDFVLEKLSLIFSFKKK